MPPAILRPKAWSNGPTGIWRPASCPGASSPARLTSTPSYGRGCSWPTPATNGPWAAPPNQRVQADREAMHPLPPVAPLTGWRTAVRLPRDHYVRVAGNDYSVDPAVIGRLVEVVAGRDTVTVTCADSVVAVHERCWARHQTLTDPAHRAAAVQLRQAHTSHARRHAERGSGPAPAVQVDVRSLSDYDALFGVEVPTARRPSASEPAGGCGKAWIRRSTAALPAGRPSRSARRAPARPARTNPISASIREAGIFRRA